MNPDVASELERADWQVAERRRYPTLMERATAGADDLEILEKMALRLARHARQPLNDVWCWPIRLLVRQHDLLADLLRHEYDLDP